MAKPFLHTRWWTGTFSPDVTGWEHCAMPLIAVQDFYWRASALSMYGSVTGTVPGVGSMDVMVNGAEVSPPAEARDLISYRPRYVNAVGSAQSGLIQAEGEYVFAGPLHYENAEEHVYYPELVCRIEMTRGPTPRYDLGTVSIVPNESEPVGEARLMDGFASMLVLPLYYYSPGPLGLTDVEASVTVNGVRWVFED